jgi:heptosyltransferase II
MAATGPEQERISGQRILVIGPAWVGDMILAQSLFKALKKRDPQAFLAVAAPDFTRPLLDLMPEVDEALPLPFEHGEARLAGRWRYGRQLKRRGFDRGIVLPGSFKAALPLRAAGIRQRSGYRGEGRRALLTDARHDDKKHRRTVDRFVALAVGPDETPPPVEPPHLRLPPGATEAAQQALGLTPSGRPLLALCPGAEYGPAKRWPARHFALVARHWLAVGGQVQLFGGPGDRPAADALVTALGDGVTVENLVGRTTLTQAAALLAGAKAVVTNDSGLMHLAAALGRPLVALFGPSDPALTPPLAHDAAVLALALDCQPCHARRCPLVHHKCLEELSPRVVSERLAPILDQAAHHP